jgi:hypothetical protein
VLLHADRTAVWACCSSRDVLRLRRVLIPTVAMLMYMFLISVGI